MNFWVALSLVLCTAAFQQKVTGAVIEFNVDEDSLAGYSRDGYEESDDDENSIDTGNQLRVAATTSYAITAWPQGQIFYEITKNVFKKNETDLINQAMCLIEKASCVSFIPRKKDTRYYITIVKATKCSAKIGRQSAGQLVNLDPSICFSRVGQVCHELFHALGFIHELQRNDRDDYILVNLENVTPQSIIPSAFGVIEPIAANYKGPFDFNSIMLYNRMEFAMKGTTAFDVKPGVTVPAGDKIGQRSNLSDGDISKLNDFYECDYITPIKSILNCA